MKILAVSDAECAALWDNFVSGSLEEYDLILACGNLKAEYLSFLVTMARCPVLYVPGDGDDYKAEVPEGCDCIDDHLLVYNGLRILGLGGCVKTQSGDHRYTDYQMARRVAKLHHKIKRLGGLDVVVTHAPAKGLGDGAEPADSGFPCFLELMELYCPKFLIHGHVRPRYTPGYGTLQREHTYQDTTVVNAWERCTIEVPDNEFKEKHRNKIIWKTRHKD